MSFVEWFMVMPSLISPLILVVYLNSLDRWYEATNELLIQCGKLIKNFAVKIFKTRKEAK